MIDFHAPAGAVPRNCSDLRVHPRHHWNDWQDGHVVPALCEGHGPSDVDEARVIFALANVTTEELT